MLVQKVVESSLNKVAPFLSVFSSAYGFGKICIKVYLTSFKTKAIINGVKGVLIECSLPYLKYPALCIVKLAFVCRFVM